MKDIGNKTNPGISAKNTFKNHRTKDEDNREDEMEISEAPVTDKAGEMYVKNGTAIEDHVLNVNNPYRADLLTLLDRCRAQTI